jgi:tetratricopeptide (TPR) repeat protein
VTPLPETSGNAQARTRWRASAGVVAILAVAALGIARTQPRLARLVHDVKEADDVYVLPPPDDLRVLSLGYDAATVDLLWAKLLVAYGTHWQERRPFDARPYLDALLALEPTYAPVYRFADTLLVFRPPRGTEDDARAARAYLERGLRERPGDHAVWLSYGQFLAFLGPSFLTSQEEKDRWRHDGAAALMRAVELGADADRSLAAATILSKYGERDTVIKHLQRAYALTDDPQTRDEIAAKLARLEASARQTTEVEEAQRAVRYVEGRWRRDYPFLTRGELLLLGPSVDTARCSGPDAAFDPACARDWDDAIRAASNAP